MKKKNFKKITILFLLLLIITGCKTTTEKIKEKVEEKEFENIVEPHVEEEKQEAEQYDIGLYINNQGTRKILSTYDSNYPQYQDIISLEAYYTKDENLIAGNQKNVWNHYQEKYPNQNLKIGYQIEFTIPNQKFNQIILNPGDVESFFDYIQVYLYDDIHQDNSWYSHVSKEEVTDETIFTSIKLTGSTKIKEITSPITLTAFVYDTNKESSPKEPNDSNSYQITINKN